MPPTRILDSHIHLWPRSATTPANHGWMIPGHQLAKQKGIDDYLRATKPTPFGAICIEADRHLPSTAIETKDGETNEQVTTKLKEWAREPLQEVEYLSRIANGQPEPGDGFFPGHGDIIKAFVLWAPFHLSPRVFQLYLHLAQSICGPKLWSRVAGFRYLLQGARASQVAGLATNEAWLENIVSLNSGRGDQGGWSFDIGIDSNRDGIEMLHQISKMIEAVREKEGGPHAPKHVTFILNHLTKPPLHGNSFHLSPAYYDFFDSLRTDPNIYIKLSGAFNEFDPDSGVPTQHDAVISCLQPLLDCVFITFPRRVMFGSDWPVCDIGGPKGDQGNWVFWMEIVQKIVGKSMNQEEQESIWWEAAKYAYKLDL